MINQEELVDNVEVILNDVGNCMFAFHDLIEATLPLFETFAQLQNGDSVRLEFSRDDIGIFIDAFQTAQTVRIKTIDRMESLTDTED